MTSDDKCYLFVVHFQNSVYFNVLNLIVNIYAMFGGGCHSGITSRPNLESSCRFNFRAFTFKESGTSVPLAT